MDSQANNGSLLGGASVALEGTAGVSAADPDIESARAGPVPGNIPLTNIQAFYEAFDVKPGDKMYRDPANRVKIW